MENIEKRKQIGRKGRGHRKYKNIEGKCVIGLLRESFPSEMSLCFPSHLRGEICPKGAGKGTHRKKGSKQESKEGVTGSRKGIDI